MSLGDIYLFIAAALIFSACFFAARKLFPRLHVREMAGMGIVALLTVVLIWTLLAAGTRKRDGIQLLPATEPKPLLQPSPE